MSEREREREREWQPHLFCARAATKLERSLSLACTIFWPSVCFNLVSLSVFRGRTFLKGLGARGRQPYNWSGY